MLNEKVTTLLDTLRTASEAINDDVSGLRDAVDAIARHAYPLGEALREINALVPDADTSTLQAMIDAAGALQAALHEFELADDLTDEIDTLESELDDEEADEEADA